MGFIWILLKLSNILNNTYFRDLRFTSTFLILLCFLCLGGDAQSLLPDRLWGTYYGGTGNEVVLSMCTDSQGNLIMAGETSSTENIATPGAYQETMAGEGDAFLAKFDPDGNRLWGTYFGGLQQDVGWCCRTDSLGNIYLSGHTLSNSGIATTGAHQTALRGERDAFLVKFSPAGTRIWATYFGGDDQEAGYGCEAEPGGTVYLTGYTNSATYIATSGSHQPAQGGDNDGFLAKFTPTGQQIWGTYYGGILNDAGSACRIDSAGNIYLFGASNSTSAISTAGSHQPFNGGDFDAFLVRFDTGGQRFWGTYMGGIYADHGLSLSLDPAGNPYIAGNTQSPDQIASPGAHQEQLGGLTDGFLAKFTAAGERSWGTYYGGELMDEVRSCDAGTDSSILIAGYTASTTGISSPGAYQPQSGGERDAFCARFNPAGNREWGTYYGGTEDEMGYACASLQDAIYLAGFTASTGGISTPGSLQATYGGGDRDGFLVKFSEAPVGILEKSEIQISIFPNPSDGHFTISENLPADFTCQLLITDLTGREMVRGLFSGGQIYNHYSLSLLPGVYLIRIITLNDSKTLFYSLFTIL